MFGELGETPYQSLKEEQEEFMSGGYVIVGKQAHVLLKDNFFKRQT
jgi:hypothetical protein